jgi:archaellum component FlaC
MAINFEQDQQDAMKKTENIQSLADQVEMLEGLHKRIETSENNIKDLKKEYQRISGEVIPTMMSEMGLAELKIRRGYTDHDVRDGFSRIKTTRWITS